MLRIEHLIKMRPIINLQSLAKLAGMPSATLNSKMVRNTQLSVDESERLGRVLNEHGIIFEGKDDVQK